MNRGEIWLVNFDPTLGAEIKKTRPAVIISGQPFNRLRRTVVVVPLSSAHDQTEFPLLIAIHSSGKPSVAVVDQIKAAPRNASSENWERRPPLKWSKSTMLWQCCLKWIERWSRREYFADQQHHIQALSKISG